MSRGKNKRIISFKPSFKTYAPLNQESTGISQILDEEIEAIYLMDVLELYQEEAAFKMGVSRPTFTRIIKNARKKLANALVMGHKIEIQDGKKDYIVAICLEDKDRFDNTSIDMNYIVLYKIDNQTVEYITKIDNPILKKLNKPAIILPPILLENSVDCFIASKIGEGLKNSLLSKGIVTKQQSKLTKEDLIKLL